MPYRPHGKEDMEKILSEIEMQEKLVSTAESYINRLQEKISNGEWYSDKLSEIPLPKPDCYLCIHSTSIIKKCNKKHAYGSPCKDYKHFADKQASPK